MSIEQLFKDYASTGVLGASLTDEERREALRQLASHEPEAPPEWTFTLEQMRSWLEPPTDLELLEQVIKESLGEQAQQAP